MSALVDSLLDSLFPPRCALCAGRTQGFGLCTPCLFDLPWLVRTCAACGGRLRGPDEAPCPACLSHSACHPADAVHAALRYEYPVDRLLAALKYQRIPALARPLGEALAISLAELQRDAGLRRPDVVLPVPLHPRRAAERGFNQAALLAEVVAKAQRRPLALDLLTRVADTPPQATLPRARRLSNLRAAFVAKPAVSGRRVALVDDVLTTGATVRAAAQALRKAGAQHIVVWCAARTVSSAGKRTT